jgi:hypothetical protein
MRMGGRRAFPILVRLFPFSFTTPSLSTLSISTVVPSILRWRPSRVFACESGRAVEGRLVYNGRPPTKSLQERTSVGMPSFLGSFSLMH